MFSGSRFFLIEYVYINLENHVKKFFLGNRPRLVSVRHCALYLNLFISYIIKQLFTTVSLNMM